MKGLILAAGKGNRLNSDINKCMIKYRGKPILEYNIERAFGIPDINEVLLIVGYRFEDIINYFSDDYGLSRGIKIIYQKNPSGVIDAIKLAKSHIGNHDFFLLLGDEVLINSKHLQMVETFKRKGLFGICGIVREQDKKSIQKTYSIITDSNRIIKLEEKPRLDMILNNIKGTGHCIFRNEILKYLDNPIVKNRKPSDFISLVQCAVNDNKLIEIFPICDKYFNINIPDDLEELKDYINYLKS